jgi:hypothetical protein
MTNEIIKPLIQGFISAIKKANSSLGCAIEDYGNHYNNIVDYYYIVISTSTVFEAALITVMSHHNGHIQIALSCRLQSTGEEWGEDKYYKFDPTDPSWDPQQTIEELVEKIVKQIGEIRE